MEDGNAFFDWLLELKYGTPEEREKKKQADLMQQQQQMQGNALEQHHSLSEGVNRRNTALNQFNRY